MTQSKKGTQPCDSCEVVDVWAKVFCSRQFALFGSRLSRRLHAELGTLEELTYNLADPKSEKKYVSVAAICAEVDGFCEFFRASRFEIPLAAESLEKFKAIHGKLLPFAGRISSAAEDEDELASQLSECINITRQIVETAEKTLADHEGDPSFLARKGRRQMPRPTPVKQVVTTRPPESTSEAAFNVLVLGDLHQGAIDTPGKWEIVCCELFKDLDNLEDREPFQCEWDLVAFVGDLTNKAKPRQFRGVERILKEFWKRWDKKRWNPKFVAVPGNHDLHRPDEEDVSPELSMLRRFSEDETTARGICGDQKDLAYEKKLKQIFKEYDLWWKSQKSRWPEGLNSVGLPGEFTCVITNPGSGRRLGIMGLNSAFLHLNDMRRKESTLCIHPGQFTDAGGPKWCAEQDICILLTHHPPWWLFEKNLNEFKRQIATPDNFPVHICGHQHEPISVSIAERSQKPCHCIVNHSLFGRNKCDGNTRERIFGFTAVQLRKVDHEWRLRWWPRKANPKRNWVVEADRENFQLEPDDGTKEVVVKNE